MTGRDYMSVEDAEVWRWIWRSC